MTEETTTTAATEMSIDHPDDNLSPKEVSSLIEGTTLEIHTGEEETTTLPLHDVMADVTAGHYELDAYRRGALTYCDALDEEIDAANNRGETELAELLSEVRDVTFSLYDRIEEPSEDTPTQED